MSAIEMNIMTEDFWSKGKYFWIAYAIAFVWISMWTYYDRGDYHYHIDSLRRRWRCLRQTRRMTCPRSKKMKN